MKRKICWKTQHIWVVSCLLSPDSGRFGSGNRRGFSPYLVTSFHWISITDNTREIKGKVEIVNEISNSVLVIDSIDSVDHFLSSVVTAGYTKIER